MACGDLGGAKCAGTQTASATGVMALSVFSTSCHWRSEGLFGQFFSIVPHIQALRGLPCLGSFSVVWCVRHIEGSPWVGSYSVVQCLRHLMGQSFYYSTADAGVWRERSYADGSTPTRDSALSPYFCGCPASLHGHLPPQASPTTISSLTSP